MSDYLSSAGAESSRAGVYLLVRQLLLVPVVLDAGQLLQQHGRVHLQTLVQLAVRHPLPVRVSHISQSFSEEQEREQRLYAL